MIASIARPALNPARPGADQPAMVVVQAMVDGTRQRFELSDVEVAVLVERARRSGPAAPPFARAVKSAADLFVDPAVESINFDPGVCAGVEHIARAAR